MSQVPRQRAPATSADGHRLPPRGVARTRMLRAVARLLWQREKAEQRIRRLREVQR